MKNIFYFPNINSIGGVESFFYYIAKKYKDRDITVYYRSGDNAQLKRLSEYVRVKKFKGERIECEKAFFNYSLDIIDYVDAKEYIQIIHADYEAMQLMPKHNRKITKYIGVSELACEAFKKKTGLNIELCYNPLEIDKPKKVLNLISATRLTKEKGKQRMIQLADALDKAGIKYIWTVFTNDINAIDNPNVVYMKPKLDIIDYIANADYLVQLSDSEAYCYSVVEALKVGTPVIVTKCSVFTEIGVNSSNGFMLDFNMDNIPVKDIYKGLPKFKYTPPEDNWNNVLSLGASTYSKEDNYLIVKPVKRYYDIERREKLTPYTPPFKVNMFRGEMLCDVGVCEIVRRN